MKKKYFEEDKDLEGGIEKISRIIEEIMEDHLKGSRENVLDKPLIYGVSMRIENGKRKVHEFGNIRKGEVLEEREPLVDIIETGKQIVVLVELPGVSKEGINIELNDKSELEIAVSDKSQKYRKTLSLPNEVESHGMKATYKNGILEVTLKRKSKRKISPE